MKRSYVFLAVGLVLALAVAAFCAVHWSEDVRTATADHVDLHPEYGLDAVGTAMTTGEGNYISPYVHLRHPGTEWTLSFTIASEVGEGYVLKSLEVEVAVPEGMRIEGIEPDTGGIDQGLHVLRGFVVQTEHSSDSARAVVLYGSDYGTTTPTISDPDLMIAIEEAEGPIECSYRAVFVNQELFGRNVEVVEGTMSVWTDLYKADMPF